MNQNLKKRKGFTLVEVLVTLAISTILFLAVSNLMVTFFKVNNEIKKDIATNDEKEIMHLTLQKFLSESDRIVYLNTTSDPTLHTFVLLNKSTSALWPFTVVTSQDSGKKYADAPLTSIKILKLQNLIYSYNGSSWGWADTFTQRPLTDSARNIIVDYANNRLFLSSTSTLPTGSPIPVCGPTKNNDCILAGSVTDSQSSRLVYGSVASAPYITITKPTDIRKANCLAPLNPGNTCLFVLAPYENREYQIDLNNFQISTTTNTGTTRFPYYYNGTSIVDLMQPGMWKLTDPVVVGLTNLATPSDIQSRYGLASLKFLQDVYASGSTTAELDQIVYTFINPLFDKDGNSKNTNPADTVNQTTSFLFQTFKK